MAAVASFKNALLDELLAGHDAQAVCAQDGLLDDAQQLGALRKRGGSFCGGQRQS